MIDSEFGDAEHPMNFLFNEEVYLPTAGEIRTGRIVDYRNNEILVDIGAKSEGLIPNQETAGFDSATRELLKEGEDILVFIVNPEDNNGNIILSYRRKSSASTRVAFWSAWASCAASCQTRNCGATACRTATATTGNAPTNLWLGSRCWPR